MIPPEMEGKIIRCHHVEKWPIGTIARQLGVHHETVERVLHQAGIPVIRVDPRSSIVDPFLPFISEKLTEYPELLASRLFAMVRERGYSGHPDHFRHVIARLRPPRPVEPFLTLRTLPGEQAQVDWAHFGKLMIGRAIRPLVAFIMVLSFSRMIFLRFFLSQKMSFFLRGHQEAFEAFSGSPRVCLYDNLKSVVLERVGQAIRFNPTLLEMAARYRYEPRPVGPYRGNEKGRVERAVRYVRGSFFVARTYTDLDDLNRQARQWCFGPAADRPCPEDRSMTVREAFEQERPRLLPLPDDPFPTHERHETRTGKYPFVRFDLNEYSIPPEHTRQPLVLLAEEKTIRILRDGKLIAEHARSFDRNVRIEDPEHLSQLQDYKREARQHRALDRLQSAVPATRDLMVSLAERGHSLGSATAALLRLLDHYGAERLQEAILEVIKAGSPHPSSVRHVLEKNATAQGMKPPLPIRLPDDPRIRNLIVRPHDLKAYDTLREINDDGQQDSP